MMFNFTIIFLLLLLIIPTIISIHMSCYSNAHLILPSNASLNYNFTLQACQCLMVHKNSTGYQYDNNDKSCYTFGNDSSRSNIQIKINSRVCFVNQTLTSYPTEATTVPSSPITISTSTSGNNYYTKDSIFLNNTVPLTSLSIVTTVPKTFGVNSSTSYTTFWANIVNATINETSDNVMYFFQLISGQTIVTGQWEITSQFGLIGQVRPTSNDTYIIHIQPYPDIAGHF